MAQEIPVMRDTAEFSAEVQLIARRGSHAGPLLCELGGGVMRFVDAAFPDVDRDAIYGQMNEREPIGRGAHFDVYNNLTTEQQPWIALFNFAGSASLRAVALPECLADSYFFLFPEPDDTAFEARRHFSQIALNAPGATILQGEIKPGMGLVLPQLPQGPHIVHDIVPKNADDPGRYLKMVVPASNRKAIAKIKNGAYKPLDEVITGELTTPVTSRHFSLRNAMSDRLPLREDTPKRPCNLD